MFPWMVVQENIDSWLCAENRATTGKREVVPAEAVGLAASARAGRSSFRRGNASGSRSPWFFAVPFRFLMDGSCSGPLMMSRAGIFRVFYRSLAENAPHLIVFVTYDVEEVLVLGGAGHRHASRSVADEISGSPRPAARRGRAGQPDRGRDLESASSITSPSRAPAAVAGSDMRSAPVTTFLRRDRLSAIVTSSHSTSSRREGRWGILVGEEPSSARYRRIVPPGKSGSDASSSASQTADLEALLWSAPFLNPRRAKGICFSARVWRLV